MNIDPKHMLIAMVIFSNIGGAMTPIGDPPNIIIISNKKIQTAGIGFGDFTLHMLPAVVLCLAGAYAFLRLIYKDMSTLRFTDPPEVVEVKHEIEVWKKAFNSLSGYSRDEDTVRAILHRKISVLETLLRKKLYDAKHLRMVQEDTGVSSEGATCAWMAADEAVGCTHAFLTMWRSSRRLVCRGRPQPGLRVNDITRIYWSKHLLTTQSERPN
ncbi:UNVERIFIED_CONTAM: Oca2 [Trichonephila clavipes]